MGQFDFFKTMLTVQLFWAFAVTILLYVTPIATTNQLTLTQYQDGSFDLLEVKSQFEGIMTSQTNIPFVNAGALIFYSGNLILNLMVNFFTFVPQMFTIILTLIAAIIPMDANLLNQLKVFITVFMGIMYVIALLSFISQYRNPGGV